MSIFSKIGGALKGAAKVVTAPERAVVNRLTGSKPAPAPASAAGSIMGQMAPGASLGGTGLSAIPGVSPSGGGGFGGGLLNALHGLGQHPSMGGMFVAHPQMPGSPPPPTGVLMGGQAPAGGMPGAMNAGPDGGISGAISGAMGQGGPLGGGVPMQGGPTPGALMTLPGGGFMPHPAAGGMGGGIAAILKAQMQKQAQAPDPSSLLRSQYPGMGASNEAGNGSE